MCSNNDCVEYMTSDWLCGGPASLVWIALLGDRSTTSHFSLDSGQLVMDRLRTVVDLRRLEEDTRRAVAEDKIYWQRNEVKIRAATDGTADYEEWRQRVEAAHLRPLQRTDFLDRSQQRTVWNPLFRRQQNY